MGSNSDHRRAFLALSRTNDARAALSGVQASRVDPRPFWEVVRDALWSAGVVDCWVGYARDGVARVCAQDREHTANRPAPLREDLEEEVLDAAEAALQTGGFLFVRAPSSTGKSSLLVTRAPAQNALL